MDAGRGANMDVDLNNNENELPFGYRFHPTPFELLQYYLVPKMKGERLPSNYIKDLEIYRYDPQQFPMNQSQYAREGEAYFFVPIRRELAQGEDNLTRSTPNGYWKIFKDNVPLYGPDGGAIGYKNKLEFYDGKDPNGIKTDWKMVEYRSNFSVNGNMESYMVCKVRHKVKVEEIYEDEEGVESSGESGANGEAENNNMGMKRPLEEEDFPEPSFAKLNSLIIIKAEFKYRGNSLSNFCELQFDGRLEYGACVADKELEASAPLSLVTSSSSEEDSGDGSTSFWPYFPEYDFSKPRRPPEKFQDPYISLLNNPPRKEVPIGPDHQAEVPMWDPNASGKDFSRSYYLADDDREQELMGTCIIPMPDLNDGVRVGSGRTDCSCLDVGSMRCVQQHVKEVREKLRDTIGDQNFVELGFYDMGEVVARKWAPDDEQVFHEIVFSNPVVFWKHLIAAFPTLKKKELVSYYFNVFMLRRRAVQNRSFLLEIDSDDDEEQKDPDEDSFQNGSYSVDRDTDNNHDLQGPVGNCYVIGGEDEDSTVESFGDEDLDDSWVDEFWSEPEKVNQNNVTPDSNVEKQEAVETDGRKDVIDKQDTKKLHDD
ncbi:hypothetical protein DH2020_049892 [Rehmannia glutinosa]|uniref:NAC domain-containing protein n=1 Tax=Rehmannia glutinosa TaxID=99300 RepID=A0ABR0U2K6_REHGL